jgi:hypothetical protein
LQVWESGFISIPHSFDVADLRPRLAMLMSGNENVPSPAADSRRSNDLANPRRSWDGPLRDASPGSEERPPSAASDADFLELDLDTDCDAAVRTASSKADSTTSGWRRNAAIDGMKEAQEVFAGGAPWPADKGASVFASDRLPSARAGKVALCSVSFDCTAVQFLRHRPRVQQRPLAVHGRCACALRL